MLIGNDVSASVFEKIRSVYIYISVDSSEEAERVYKLLAEDGQVYMLLEENFFATRFSQLRDRFGVSWSIIHEARDGTIESFSCFLASEHNGLPDLLAPLPASIVTQFLDAPAELAQRSSQLRRDLIQLGAANYVANTSTDSRLFGHLPRTLIDLNSSMSALTC